MMFNFGTSGHIPMQQINHEEFDAYPCLPQKFEMNKLQFFGHIPVPRTLDDDG